MYTKDLLHKPDDQLTEYERQLRYGEGGDPRKLNPLIDQALELLEEGEKWQADKVFQKALRVGKGHANPRSLYDLVKERIKSQMKAAAVKALNEHIRDRSGLLGMSLTEGYHHARANMITALVETTKMSISLDEIAQVTDEAIAECVKANQGSQREPEFRDSPAS